MVAITLEGVTVRYPGADDGVNALHDLSLHIMSGELLVLAGPSGSGKTTVLRTIAGLEEPLRGIVRINGRIANHLPPGARDVALVTQFESLFPHLTVEQNLAFALEVRKLPAAETTRRVHAEARVLGLWSKLSRRPRQLSSGERQKAALGRATTRKPSIYLFDEPLAGLDAGEREHVRRELRRLQRGMGVTTVYVTHDQRDAMALGDRIAVLDRGRVAQVDEPMTLHRLPADLFVAGFFGSPPMGFVRGPLCDDGSTAWIEVAGTPLRLLPSQRAATAEHRGRDVVVGLRADAVRLGNAPEGEWVRHLDMVVRNVEPLGPATVVTLVPRSPAAATTDVLHTTVAPPDPPARGTPCTATIDLRDSVVFDAATGARLWAAESSRV